MKTHTCSFMPHRKHPQRKKKANKKTLRLNFQVYVYVTYGHFQMFPDVEFSRQAFRTCSITHCKTVLFQAKTCPYILFAQYFKSNEHCDPPYQCFMSLVTRHSFIFHYRRENGRTRKSENKHFLSKKKCEQPPNGWHCVQVWFDFTMPNTERHGFTKGCDGTGAGTPEEYQLLILQASSPSFNTPSLAHMASHLSKRQH